MSATEVKVRLATVADAAMLARLRWELRSSFHIVVEDELDFMERCTLWMKERLRGDGPWQCWIAESGATAIGSVWVQLIEKIPNPIAAPKHFVYLTNFFVREEHRGQGTGSKLLAEALAWSGSKNVELILLWPTERSKPLYARYGFESANDFMELVL